MAHALYHVQFDVVQRSRGQSAVKVGAYNHATRYQDRDGTVYDFTRKAKEHQGHCVMLPHGAPAWATDSNELWRRAEAAERRCDAQPARLVEFAIPREVTAEQRMAFAQHIAAPWVAQGMAAQLDIHVTGAADGQEQPHCHVVLTRRRLTADGFAAVKERGWDKAWTASRGRDMRAQIAARMNQWLEAHGLDSRVDHRRRDGEVPSERNVSKRAVEVYKADPTHPAAEPWRATLACRSARRQLRAARGAAEQATEDIQAIGREYDRRVVGLRPRDRRRLPQSDDWLPIVGGAVIAVERDDKGVRIVLSDGAAVLDRGSRLMLSGAVTNASLAALADQAARHGWQQVELTGPPEARDKLAAALAARGIKAVNHRDPMLLDLRAAQRHLANHPPVSAPVVSATSSPTPNGPPMPRRPAPRPPEPDQTPEPAAAPAYRPPWAMAPGRRKDDSGRK